MPKELERPPPKDHPQFDAWLERLYNRVLSIEAGNIEVSGVTRHSELEGLNTDAYSHLTGSQKSALTGTGDTALHYHSTDRDRSRHTGTQSADTINNFTEAVQAVVGESGNSILEARVFGP